MGVHTGVLMRKGQDVPAHVDRLLRHRMQQQIVDGVHEVRGPGYVLFAGVRSHAGKHESWREAPATEGDSTTIFDGRIDNRDDLLLRYFNGEERTRTISDSALVNRMIRTGGPAALVGCLGDWSASVLDASARTVLLTSDAFGVRPLYYSNMTWGVVWSTDLSTLTAATGLGPSNLDVAYFAGFLIGSPPPLGVPYKGVRAVRPGAALTIDADGREHEHIFWAPWQIALRPAIAEDSALELLSLWQTIVQSRVTSAGLELFELSGGFDSSSIVCMAAQVAAQRGDAPVRTLTRLFAQDSSWNDLPFVRAVLDRHGCRSHFLDASELPNDRVLSAPVPDGPHAVDMATAWLMDDIGARTLVTGRKGDLVMQASPLSTAVVTARLRERRVADIIRDTTAVARQARVSAWRVLRDAVYPLRPDYSRDLRFPMRKRPEARATQKIEAEQIVASSVLAEARHAWASIQKACRSAPAEHRRLVSELAFLAHLRRLEPPPELAHLFHSHPFLDRRLISFVLERPPRLVSRPGQPRTLMREAFAHLLPEQILKRRSKGHAAGIVRRQFEPVARELLQSRQWALADLGVLNQPRVIAGLRQFLDNPMASPGPLRTMAWAEVWLRSTLRDERPLGYALDRDSMRQRLHRALDSGERILREPTMA